MIEILGGILGGLGFFYIGMWLLTENLKALANRRLRMAAANLVPNRFAALLLGSFAGAISQSSATLAFVAVGMLRAGFTSAERAFAILIGGNVGVTLMVLFVLLDLRLVAYCIGGAAGILLATRWASRFRHLLLALFGISLLFGGLSLMRESAGSISDYSWVEELLNYSLSSYWFSFVAAAVLTFVLQSGIVVIVFGMAVVSAGLLSADPGHGLDHMYMYILGVHIGTSCILTMLSWNLAGSARRVAMFHVLFNIGMCCIFVPLFYVEVSTGVPLLIALVENIDLAVEKQLAIYLILLQVFNGIPFIIFLTPVGRLYARLWPDSAVESISRPQYIQDRGHVGIEASLQLAVLEQLRVITAFSSYLDAARQRSGADSLSSAARQLLGEISEFLTDMRQKFPSRLHAEHIDTVLTRQRFIEWLENRISELCEDLNNLPDDETAVQMRDLLIESVDSIVMAIIDELRNETPEQRSMILELTRDRDEALRRIRRRIFSSETDLTDEVQAGILKATNTAAEIFFLLHRLAQQMQPAEEPPVTLGRIDNL